jgi:hypothetical protein
VQHATNSSDFVRPATSSEGLSKEGFAVLELPHHVHSLENPFLAFLKVTNQ